nr:immunoglobulin heavy chain junction region [Mus musculus]MBK4196186.1 immunoglobulin heavy chain junction region [Mus musculus]
CARSYYSNYFYYFDYW